MSDEYLILFMELNPPEEMVGDPEHHLHCASLVGPPDAEGVASDICIVLNRDVGFMRNAAPHFAARPADDPPDALLAQFTVERNSYAGHEGRPDGDPHSRAVSYNHKAEACLAPVRKLRGLPHAKSKQPASSVDTGTGAQGGQVASTPGGIENTQDGAASSLDDIPRLDKADGRWVKQKEAATIAGLTTGTLKKERFDGEKADDGCSGVTARGHWWRKDSKNAQTVRYYKSSLS